MTEKLRTKLIGAFVVLQVAFFGGWYAYENGAFSKPVAKIMVKTEAYDPRDFLSGQYIRLDYSFSNPASVWDNKLKKSISPKWSEEISGDHNDPQKYEIWLILHKADGFYEPQKASYTKPDNLAQDDVLIKGYKTSRYRIEYGLEKYFVPEGTEEPNRDDTTVELNVYKGGRARIAQVYVKNKPWP